jgi:HSP20 family protein
MLMRTDPFRELDRLTQQVLGTAARPAAMPIDAYRRGDWFYVHFDLPGVKPDDIELTVERNVLTVRAQRRGATEDAEGIELIASERPQGTFSRQLFLGESLDADKLEADYDAGVLTIRLPVAEHAKPRRVEVSASGQRQQIST